MSDEVPITEKVVDAVLARLDALAGRLGIAVSEIWGFTVKAKLVEARRDLLKGAAWILLLPICFGWGVHVLTMHLPHDKHVQETRITKFVPCDVSGFITNNGVTKQVVQHNQCPETRDDPTEVEGDISSTGIVLVITGIVATLVGLIVAGTAIASCLNALAASKTAEYDAYKDLISDWN